MLRKQHGFGRLARPPPPEQSTIASVVRALPNRPPLRIGDRHAGNRRNHRGVGGGRARHGACLCRARGADWADRTRHPGAPGRSGGGRKGRREGAGCCRSTSPIADAVEAAAESVENQFGPIDIWVNCAMATIFSPFHRISPEEFRRATEVTYLGFVYGTMAALKRMRPRNRGTIVQVGSASAYRAIPLQSAYCGAKFAIRGFTDSLRTELMHDGVDVSLRHGPDAGAQYPAVQLGAQQDEPAAPAGAADLSARSRRRGDLLRGPFTPP